MKRIVAALAVAAAVQAHGEALHGKTDAFSAPGVSLAWAVERGPDESKTLVVIRVAVDPAKYRAISVTGRDPFTKEEKPLMARTPIAGKMDVRLARSGFAELPRTELRFYGADPAPTLEVFYLGVPDTTPEFADRGKLEGYLDARIPKLDPGPSPR